MTIPFIGHVFISGLLMLNVYAKDWPVEATISEASRKIFCLVNLVLKACTMAPMSFEKCT